MVIRVDLRRCFESVTVARVRAVFAAVGYPSAVARALADLCTTTTPSERLVGMDPVHAAMLRSRHLPQGAPTSPALANLVMRTLDRRITGYARRHGLVYTRYGDDLAVSGVIEDPSAVVWVVGQIVADEGLTVHGRKTRIMYAHQQQRLTGLVVNDRPRVSRSEYDDLRALLHNAIRSGARAQNHDGVGNFEAHVRGRIAWVGFDNSTRRDTLLDMASRVDWADE
ncbi:reverse transcriptase family protein [Williamsia sp. MIQD14]|uniref:reverse transcriptase family protein n=1 Tax=Williamsia sp. MIQD14 TaxID=3425703 RepID=UPI003DA14082